MERRAFLQTSAAAAALSLAARESLAALAEKPAKRVGLIGTGWYGKVDLLRLIQVAPVEVVSLCDVDAQMLDGAATIVSERQVSKKRPRLYSDYRKMLAEKDLDIVLIATPDHWHALPMIEAVKAGADVYVQKPTGVDVIESQAMLAAARKYNRVVQVGTQRRSTPHLIEARDRVVREGLLGKVGHVEVCCYYHMRLARIRHKAHRPSTSITKCGLGLHRCVPTLRWRILASGELSWSIPTASWATCAFTCLTWFDGCWISIGLSEFLARVGFWLRRKVSLTRLIRKPQHLLIRI